MVTAGQCIASPWSAALGGASPVREGHPDHSQAADVARGQRRDLAYAAASSFGDAHGPI